MARVKKDLAKFAEYPAVQDFVEYKLVNAQTAINATNSTSDNLIFRDIEPLNNLPFIIQYWTEYFARKNITYEIRNEYNDDGLKGISIYVDLTDDTELLDNHQYLRVLITLVSGYQVKLPNMVKLYLSVQEDDAEFYKQPSFPHCKTQCYFYTHSTYVKYIDVVSIESPYPLPEIAADYFPNDKFIGIAKEDNFYDVLKTQLIYLYDIHSKFSHIPGYHLLSVKESPLKGDPLKEHQLYRLNPKTIYHPKYNHEGVVHPLLESTRKNDYPKHQLFIFKHLYKDNVNYYIGIKPKNELTQSFIYSLEGSKYHSISADRGKDVYYIIPKENYRYTTGQQEELLALFDQFGLERK